MPELLTVIRVIPERNEMVENEEVERIGMEVASDGIRETAEQSARGCHKRESRF